jgi:sulfate transport system ATP-binding protein
MSIEVVGLSRRYGLTAAVDDVSFRVNTGELVALLGPSGSGKSTLLRTIAGLETPDAGEIHLAGRNSTTEPPRERNVGFVFQHYALFRHQTVERNIAFGLNVRKVPRDEIRRRVGELLDLVQLKGLEKRYPSQLSGGQRQRVAVARALAARPGVLLLDEPFGALDAKVREDLRRWILELHEMTRVTTLFVTHDQHEALEIAHRILVMNRGHIEQEGSPREIFDNPATPFVAGFVGENNLIRAGVTEPHVATWGPLRFAVNGYPAGRVLAVYFRPNDVCVSASEGAGLVRASVVKTRFRGPAIELLLRLGEEQHIVSHVPRDVTSQGVFREGSDVYIGIRSYHAYEDS